MVWLFIAFLISFAQLGLGAFVWRAGRFGDPNGWFALLRWGVLCYALGVIASGTLILLVGMIAIPARWVFWGLTIGLTLFALSELLRLTPRRFPRLTWLDGLAILAILFLRMALLWMTLIPELEVDSIAYHLTVPRAYLNWGQILAIPFEPHSNWHSLFQMGNLWALALEGDSVIPAKLLELTRCEIAAAGVAAAVAMIYRRDAALPAAAIFLANEIVARYGVTAHVDAGQSLLTVAGVLAGVVALQAEKPARWIVLAALIFGALGAVKQTGYALAGAGCGALALVLWQRKVWQFDGQLLQQWAMIAGSGAAPVLPWLGKNWILTGNPFFPFLSPWIPSNREAAIGLTHILNYYPDNPEPVPPLAHLYVIVTNVGLADVLSCLILVPLAWLGFVTDRNRTIHWEPRVFLLTACLTPLPLLIYAPYSRFLAGLVALAVAAAAGELSNALTKRFGSGAAKGALAGLIVLYTWNFWEFARFEQFGRKALAAPPHWPVLTEEDQEQYYREFGHGSLWIDRINREAPADAVLAVSAKIDKVPLIQRRFWPTVPVVTRPLAETLADLGFTAEQIAEEFQNLQVTHLLTEESFDQPAAQEFRERYLVPVGEREGGAQLFLFFPDQPS